MWPRLWPPTAPLTCFSWGIAVQWGDDHVLGVFNVCFEACIGWGLV